MTSLDLLAGRTIPPFLLETTVRDRSWRRVAAMAVAGPVATVGMSLLVVLALFGAGRLAGLRLNVVGGEMADLPRLIQSSAYVLEVGLGLAAAAAGLILAARVIFRRRLRTWITTAPRFRVTLLAWGFGAGGVALAGLSMASLLLPGGEGEPPILDAAEPLTLRLAYALASLSGFLIAAWAEEVVFRGYLLQQMSVFTRRLWLVLLVNGLAFALFHLEFDPGALAARTLLGMVFAWSALRLGGLEFGIGAHAAQNLGIALFGEVLLPTTPETTISAHDMGMEILLAAIIMACVESLHRRRRLAALALA